MKHPNGNLANAQHGGYGSRNCQCHGSAENPRGLKKVRRFIHNSARLDTIGGLDVPSKGSGRKSSVTEKGGCQSPAVNAYR